MDDDLRHLADREIDLSRRRTAHFQKLYEGALDELEIARAAISRVRNLHRIHRCAVDGHRLSRTPSPCVNDGFCRCGQRNPCSTLEALDSPKGTTS